MGADVNAGTEMDAGTGAEAGMDMGVDAEVKTAAETPTGEGVAIIVGAGIIACSCGRRRTGGGGAGCSNEPEFAFIWGIINRRFYTVKTGRTASMSGCAGMDSSYPYGLIICPPIWKTGPVAKILVSEAAIVGH
jgi:hypothetical protein